MQIRSIRVDVDSLLSIDYACEPALCRDRTSCCGCYEVCLGAREISKVTSMMPYAARYVPDLEDDGDFENPFDQVERNLWAMETDEDGLCVFAYKNKSGATLCSVHSAAFDLNIDPAKVKPKSCMLWPLSLSEDKPPVLSVQDDAQTFPCVRKRRKGKRLCAGVAETIRDVFGQGFLDELTAGI